MLMFQAYMAQHSQFKQIAIVILSNFNLEHSVTLGIEIIYLYIRYYMLSKMYKWMK